MKITMPAASEYAEHYSTYVQKTQYDDLLVALRQNEQELVARLSAIPADKAEYRYAEGKWTIKEVIVHLSDAERVFAYRALRFSRNDKTDLSPFEENNYAVESNAANMSLPAVISELQTVRAASISLFAGMSEEMSLRQGTVKGRPVSVRALGAIILGHTIHHLQVLNERYL